MKILALDSGLERTGWAVYEVDGSEYKLIAYDCLTTDKKYSLQSRLNTIREELNIIVDEHKPSKFVIERLFFFANKTSVIPVAQAQGVTVLVAGEHNLDVEFLTPSEIKQALTGYGNADKKSVQKMVKMLLNIDPLPTPDDTVDAIACGLTYCTMRKIT